MDAVAGFRDTPPVSNRSHTGSQSKIKHFLRQMPCAEFVIDTSEAARVPERPRRVGHCASRAPQLYQTPLDAHANLAGNRYPARRTRSKRRINFCAVSSPCATFPDGVLTIHSPAFDRAGGFSYLRAVATSRFCWSMASSSLCRRHFRRQTTDKGGAAAATVLTRSLSTASPDLRPRSRSNRETAARGFQACRACRGRGRLTADGARAPSYGLT